MKNKLYPLPAFGESPFFFFFFTPHLHMYLISLISDCKTKYLNIIPKFNKNINRFFVFKKMPKNSIAPVKQTQADSGSESGGRDLSSCSEHLMMIPKVGLGMRQDSQGPGVLVTLK